MCILLNVKKHEKTFALNVDIFNNRNCGIKGLTSKISIGKIYEKVWKRNSNHWKPSERKRQVRVFDGR